MSVSGGANQSKLQILVGWRPETAIGGPMPRNGPHPAPARQARRQRATGRLQTETCPCNHPGRTPDNGPTQTRPPEKYT